MKQSIELKIFKQSESFWGEVTLSQYLFLISLILFLFCFMVCYVFKINFIYTTILFIPLIISYVTSVFEYENLNGHIIGKIVLETDKIIINNKTFNYTEIESLKFDSYSYYGKNNSFSGIYDFPRPFKLIGKNNKFLIISKENQNFSGEFLISSKEDFLGIYDLLSNLYFNEILKTDIHKLYNLPELIQKNRNFKNFVEKLLTEKRIDCGYGISLLGYNNDKEAKILRSKYCS